MSAMNLYWKGYRKVTLSQMYKFHMIFFLLILVQGETELPSVDA